ncbi:hypothetical protein GGS21DRAFT_342121 [Xylaria nigripes]|nr:hypothetical protein GGS21DRAFT_342121 [Xylaria nigripes]
MGIHPKLDLQRSSICSVTPPGLVSPVSAVSLPVTPGDKFFGRIIPISPPTSSYESTIKTADMSLAHEFGLGLGQQGLRNEPPRQQLPSLSSLFAANQYLNPLNSPPAERPSQLYRAQSPSARTSSISNTTDRSSTYLSNVSPAQSQPRPIYEPRLQSQRPLLPSVAQSFPGPLSPPLREYDRVPRAHRNSTNVHRKWAQSISDVRRSESVYSTGPSTSTLRPTGEHRESLPSMQRFGYETSQSSKADGQSQSGRLSCSPTSSSPESQEGVPVKDGLGPKIWTGTHFLPRFIRRAEVPGEGLCYFYDDGTHCKTVIDGEPVNAHWGVTKAGKPRKRLAIACLTCREKKIKCDPDYPRCVQCEKFGRVCKFKNAPRGGHNTSPATSPTEQVEPRQLALPPRVPELPSPRSVSSSSSMSSHTKISRTSPELPSLPSKKPRLSYAQYSAPPTSYPYPMIPPLETKSASASWQSGELPRIRDEGLYRLWPTDPYGREPQRLR